MNQADDNASGDVPEKTGMTRNRMLWIIAAVAAVGALTITLIVGLVHGGRVTAIDDAIARGERAEAPAFTLPVLAPGPGVEGPEGREVSLADLRGKVVVLNLWASWCGPCENEAPLLQALSDRRADDGVVVLGVNIEDGSESAKNFLRNNELRIPSLRSRDNRIKTDYGAIAVPETFVIDRQGRVALAIRGEFVTAQLEQLDRVVGELVAEPQPGTETVPNRTTTQDAP